MKCIKMPSLFALAASFVTASLFAGVPVMTLTFDDNPKGHLTVAAPVLERYGFRGSFCVVTGSVGKGPKHLTWNEVRELHERGHEIVSHTVSHPNLVKMLADKGREAVLSEMNKSREAILRATGRAPRFLCHPGCCANAQVDDVVRASGMTPMGVRRHNFGTGTTPATFADFLDKAIAAAKAAGDKTIKYDLLFHGVSKDSGGWLPIATAADFEGCIAALAEREKKGLIKVVDYKTYSEIDENSAKVPTLTRVTLADNAKAQAVIVIAKDADKAARFGAADLKWHLDTITGGDFKILNDDDASLKGENAPFCICVGPSALTKAKRDDFASQEFAVKAYPGRIELVGRDRKDKGKFIFKIAKDGVHLKNAPGFYDEQGTMYAVYDFLEKECRAVWADTSDLGTVLPRDSYFTVRVNDRVDKPFFPYRGGTIEGHRLKLDLWKNGTEGSKAYRAVAFHNPKRYDNQDRLFRLRNRIGGVKLSANHSFAHYYNMYWNENAKNFVRKWPEIFAKGYIGQPPQMCYTSPEFIELVIKDIRAYFDQDPETGRFVWGPNNYCLEGMDNSCFCKCPTCAPMMEPERASENGAESTYWFTFVKKVAEEIKKSHPTKQISTLAYHSHEALPRGVVLPGNVVVYFCIYANRMPYSLVLENQLKRMKQWREAYPKQPIAMWLYNTFPLEYTNKGGFNCLPGFFGDEAYKLFQFFKENNIRAGIFNCGFNGEVDSYMHLKWMINPDRKVDDLIDEYFRGYGKAAAPLKEYYRAVEKRYCDKSRYPKGVMHQTAAYAWGEPGAAALMEKLAKLMAEAEAAAETPDEKRRVETWKLEYWEYMRQGYETYVERSKSPRPSWIARRIPAADGDLGKVDWNSLEKTPFNLYDAGTTDKTPLAGSSRFAHDGKWLYLELDLEIEVANNHISPGIFSHDTWELFFACQEAPPYRHYASSPDGRMVAFSNGEVNWRMNVPATESGPPCYGAKVKSDRTNAHLWRQMFAFPLDKMLDKPVKPGEFIHLNGIAVLNPKITKGRTANYILAITPATTVHITDRMGKITLEK